MSIKDRLPIVEPDGLLTPPVGEWAYKKYLRVWMYDQIVSQGMKHKWSDRVYVDLFAGAGYVRLRDSGLIVPNAAMLAFHVGQRFGRYILCDEDPEKLDALRKRIERIAPDADVCYIQGDSNERVAEVCDLVPRNALSFCFVDPYGINIKLETIRRLASGRKMDFLILLALQMDANRNRALYASEGSKRLDEFLGSIGWRKEWEEAEREGGDFRRFLADQYVRAMMRIGYAQTSIEDMYEMRTESNVSIYYLAFFSKHPLGYRYWKEALKYSDEQRSLFD